MSKPMAVGVGLGVGVVAALLMTLEMVVLRFVLGIAGPPELVGDRTAPLLGIDLFFSLIGFMGGYNQLKQLGVGSILVGQVVAGAMIGVGYAFLTERGRGRGGWWRGLYLPAIRAVTVLGLSAWVVSIIALWPVLDTNFRGLPPAQASVASALGLFVAFGSFGIALLLGYRFVAESVEIPRPFWTRGDLSRRAFVIGAVGTAASLVSGILLQRLYELATFAYDGLRYHDLEPQPIVPNDRFYVVTKNVIDPRVVRDLWRLEITGLVEHPATYRFEDVAALPTVTQETTLMCISNGVGDGLMSNAAWRGVPLSVLLNEARPQPGVMEVICHAVDGYTDTVSITKAMEQSTLIAYEMNNVPLPEQHGYPVRLIIPGLFGEKNVKWLTRIELVNYDAKGFYEQQGWGPSFVVPIRTHFEGPDLSQPVRPGSLVALKGTAFAGDRGVAKVEISTDGGQRWNEASIEYPGTRFSWAIWSYDWRPSAPGKYELVVRASDGTGALQSSEERGIVPEGATGYHRLVARVEA